MLIVDIGGSENGTKGILFWYSIENAFLNKTKKNYFAATWQGTIDIR